MTTSMSGTIEGMPARPAMVMTSAERAAGRFMRAPDHGAAAAIFGGEGGGAGGDGGEGGGTDTTGGSGSSDTVAGGGGSDTVSGGNAPDWLQSFSAEAIDAETPSHRDWLGKKGFKDINDIVKSYRDTEKALRSGNKVELPGEGATPEQIAAFNKAIGVPEKADGYEIALPDGVEGQLDERLVGSFREAALAAGVPKGAAEGLGKWFVEFQLDANAAIVAARKQETEQLLASWGGEKDANLGMIRRAADKLGLDAGAVADIQQGFGAKRTLDLMLQLGKGLAEDSMLQGGGRGKFGITVEDARAQKDGLMKDPAFTAKLRAGDPEATAKLQRLNDVIVADMDRQQGRGAG